MSEVHQVSTYCDGLKRATQAYVKLRNATPLSEAIDKAAKYEMSHLSGEHKATREKPRREQQSRGRTSSSQFRDKKSVQQGVLQSGSLRPRGTDQGWKQIRYQVSVGLWCHVSREFVKRNALKTHFYTNRTIKGRLGDNKMGESILAVVKIKIRLQCAPNYQCVAVVFAIPEEFDCVLGMSFFVDEIERDVRRNDEPGNVGSEKAKRFLHTDWETFQDKPAYPVLVEYKGTVFKPELPDGLPMGRDIEHRIDVKHSRYVSTAVASLARVEGGNQQVGTRDDPDGTDPTEHQPSRGANFMCAETATETVFAQEVATLFIDNIWKLHGMPQDIVSDRDTKFVSGFGSQVFDNVGTKLKMTVAYPVQGDGQTKRTNQTLQSIFAASYLHDKMTGMYVLQTQSLPSTQRSTPASICPPFEANISYVSPEPTLLVAESSRRGLRGGHRQGVQFIEHQAAVLRQCQDALEYAQARMADMYNRGRKEQEFNVAD
ncbi:hypothetical protein F442_14961 [Phytophthora nicotianae P10297]|uniref:Integrase catalytic domain-containing protein n=1 Tax=Phytophthora nicotianae P10297 TaxID=1317064 RepID=W2YQY6_PHYNI|nr:hypothetical protein F442_14961 [Phytophthora nicotianae P10297]